MDSAYIQGDPLYQDPLSLYSIAPKYNTIFCLKSLVHFALAILSLCFLWPAAMQKIQSRLIVIQSELCVGLKQTKTRSSTNLI